MFTPTLLRTVVIVALFIVPFPGVSRASELQFYRSVTLRGVLSFEHHRKQVPPPEVSYSTYVLRTPRAYVGTYKMSARRIYVQTGLDDFYVEAPHHFSLIPYRGHAVEISGRLVPEGKFHRPALIVDKITRIRDANI